MHKLLVCLILFFICSVYAEYGDNRIEKQLITLNKTMKEQNKLLEKLIYAINHTPEEIVQKSSDTVYTEYLKYDYKPKKNAPPVKAVPTNFEFSITKCKSNCISTYGSSWSAATEEEKCELDCERNNYE